MSKRIKAFIVDDSAVVRRVLTDVLAADPAIDVIGAAADPLFAQQKMADNWPDVIVLDIEMPRMDGLSFLRQLMAERPTPVVICSTLTERGAKVTVDALALGAISIVTKPKLGLKEFLQGAAKEFAEAVKAASQARLKAQISKPSAAAAVRSAADKPRTKLQGTTDQVVAIGTSTGGTRALEVILTALPIDCPGIVIVQHMPERFTAAFAERLDRLCDCTVREARDGDRVQPGRVLIAPGGRHVQLKRSGARYHVKVFDGPKVNRHKPSVDVLFRSTAESAGRNALGIIMTGMGNDGARGLQAMRQAGAATIAQDEETSVVFGMPKAAIELHAVEQVLPLGRIADAILAR
ncbi:chemotaxis response regulator protein-glutamate methylesterase [Alkalilimnicola ehrlichii]|uniref:Protein-glutamate methylesterase/protein-glutamine glutaminase n=1 Tax=Alkalilimnicola ehrlichii TaxID=351052 RepID=A0A3E0X031_9GAMM|nr:chemotaxis response regulator protein-glutamate methylesterase [Alkalilimnicola ehrlichii]RFA28437.1 chemotaxis response regulator protein-glutamate methylesterase [Alkalilimnicola ehrlichii]RFA38687.1 chemotaxis response regulator protein-glutamate methylesterase [Alkalilimnicola ehrlichii]